MAKFVERFKESDCSRESVSELTKFAFEAQSVAERYLIVGTLFKSTDNILLTFKVCDALLKGNDYLKIVAWKKLISDDVSIKLQESIETIETLSVSDVETEHNKNESSDDQKENESSDEESSGDDKVILLKVILYKSINSTK